MKPGIVLTFGHFNPPTKSSMRLIQRVIDESLNYRYDHAVFISHDVDKKSKPLPYKRKIHWVNESFGDSIVFRSSLNSLNDILENFDGEYKNVIIVTDQNINVGSNKGFKNINVIKVEPSNIALKESIINDDYEYFCESISDKLSNQEKALLFSEVSKAFGKYNLNENQKVWIDPKTGQPYQIAGDEDARTNWEYIKDIPKAIYNYAKDVWDVGMSFAQFTQKLGEFGIKRPVSFTLLVLVAYYLRRKNKDQSSLDVQMNSQIDSIYHDAKSGRLGDYHRIMQNSVEKEAEQIASKLSDQGITTKQYYHVLHRHEPQLRRMNEQFIHETFSHHQLNGAIQRVSKLPGVTYDDKAKLTNALLALRTQQYSIADNLLKTVSETARTQVQVELGIANMKSYDSTPIRTGPISNFKNNVGSSIDYGTRKLTSVGFGAGVGGTLGYAVDTALGTDGVVGGALGAGIGALSGFKTFDKYHNTFAPKSDYERLDDRVRSLERRGK